MEKIKEKFNETPKAYQNILKTISTIIGTLASFIAIITVFCNMAYLNESDTIKIIQNYEEAYHESLEILEKKDYYTESGEINPNLTEKEKTDIQNEVKEKFSKIVNDDIYEEIENHIFEKNSYSDIETEQYEFDYTYCNDDNNLNFKYKFFEIELTNPKYYKTSRNNPEDKKEFESHNRVYTVGKKFFFFGEPIIKNCQYI